MYQEKRQEAKGRGCLYRLQATGYGEGLVAYGISKKQERGKKAAQQRLFVVYEWVSVKKPHSIQHTAHSV